MKLRSDPVGPPDRLGKYRIERVLGTGAFASVYLGVDEALDAPVAIKVLADNWSHDEDIRRRFLDEARILRRADDERIVRVHAVDELADGRPYFVMDYADRGTVHQRLHDRGFSASEAVHVARQIALALDVIHSMGYVHRDVKPTNVLFRSLPEHRRSGSMESVVLGDLGLAKAAVGADGMTIVGGTPAYMAPEQAVQGAVIDGRADLYSLGVVLYEMLTGARPSAVRTLEDARDQVGRVPSPPSTRRGPLPAELDRLVMSMLAPDPADRVPSAAAVADRLDEVLRGLDTSEHGVLVAPDSVHDDPTLTSGARPAGTGLAVGGVAGGVAGLAAGTGNGGAAAADPGEAVDLAAPAGPTVIEGPARRRVWASPRNRLAAAVGLAVLAIGGGALAFTGGDGGGDTRTLAGTAAPTTTVPATTVPATTVPATTVPATTAPPTTAAPEPEPIPQPTTPRSVVAPPETTPPAPPAPTVSLDGPTSLAVGEQGVWTPTFTNAVRGRWSWANAGCPITIGSPDWSPGDWFQASFNVQADCTLVLAVFNEAGEMATARVSFAVR